MTACVLNHQGLVSLRAFNMDPYAEPFADKPWW